MKFKGYTYVARVEVRDSSGLRSFVKEGSFGARRELRSFKSGG